MTFDELRAANPRLGFALYAYEPGKGVKLEIHTPTGDVLTFSGATFDQARDLAFPYQPPPAPKASVFE